MLTINLDKYDLDTVWGGKKSGYVSWDMSETVCFVIKTCWL